MRRTLLAFALTAITAGSAAAATLDVVQTFDDPVIGPFNAGLFGGDVSVSGNNVFVGDSFDAANDEAIGRVYQFDATTGALLRTFDDPTPTSFDGFGGSISSEGERVLIGANGHKTSDLGGGQAHLFSSATGALLQTFNDPTPTGTDLFGNSVSISGDRVLIGAPRDDTNSESSGQAHLFSASTGALLQTFNSPNPGDFDLFGFSTSISGDNVAIGSIGDITSGTAEGVVHLFSATTGALLHTLNDPTPTGEDRFGNEVAVSGDLVLVGAPGDRTNGSDVGQAHLFSATTGELLLTFDDPTGSGGGLFGNSVAIDGDKVVLGAFEDNAAGALVGQAHIFSTTTGELLYTLNNPISLSEDFFGHDVAIDGDKVAVGALQGMTSADGGRQGQASLFKLPPDEPGPGPVAVSEPATLALFGLGLFGLGTLGQRRRKYRA